MKKFALLFIHIACAGLLLSAACSNTTKSKLQGNWKTNTGAATLKITAKQFTLTSDSADPEDYFIKGDTLFTSFQGIQPYTKFVIRHLDEHNLQLMGPDSILMAYTR